MSQCVEHPHAKRYYDKSTGRTRCSGCVKRTVIAGKHHKRYPLGKVTHEILDSLGKDTPTTHEPSEYGLTYGNAFGWSEHLNSLHTTPVPYQKGR